MALAAAAFVRRRRQVRVFRERESPLDVPGGDETLVKWYRLPGDVIGQLADRLLGVGLANRSNRSHALTPLQQVCTALRYFATGDCTSSVGKFVGVSPQTVSRSVDCLLEYFDQHYQEYIMFPLDRVANTERSLRFYQRAQFPGVIGAVDGTHIAVKTPTRDDEIAFVNRKGIHSINTHIVCDNDLLIMGLDARFPGSAHDSFVYQASMLEDQLNLLQRGWWLLGDSGYGCKPHLLTPLMHPHTNAEIAYNRAHKATRSVVERCIGVLKSRWRCVSLKHGGELPFTPEKCSRVILATACLHNIAIRAGIENYEENNDDDDNDDYQYDIGRIDDRQGMLVRSDLITNHFA